jgi:heterodisulfide reductase subunit C
MNPVMNPVVAPEEPEILAQVRDMVGGCMQCGTCTASCPNAFAMDLSPRRMWRMVLLGLADRVLASKTFWMCSACYACTLRCPRGLPLTSAMAALKRLAGVRDLPGARRSGAFYAAFMNNVHAFGRVQETDLMLRYFLAMRDPLLPLKYAPLGLKLLRKGKLHPAATERKGRLDALFEAARRMEDKP